MKVLIMVMLVFMAMSLPGEGSSEGNPEDVAVWLARSCVGEATWGGVETTECAALLHIYAKVSCRTGWTILKSAKKYSAAIKKRPNHPRKWIFGLNRNANKPKKWPRGLKWEPAYGSWLDALDMADRFLLGKIPDPVPQAEHFGSKYDMDNARRLGWTNLSTPDGFKNLFWSTNRKRPFPKVCRPVTED